MADTHIQALALLSFLSGVMFCLSIWGITRFLRYVRRVFRFYKSHGGGR